MTNSLDKTVKIRALAKSMIKY